MITQVTRVRELASLPKVSKVPGVEVGPPMELPTGYNVLFLGQHIGAPNTAIVLITMPADREVRECSATSPESNVGVISIDEGHSEGLEFIAVDLNVPIMGNWGLFELDLMIGSVGGSAVLTKYKYQFRKTGKVLASSEPDNSGETLEISTRIESFSEYLTSPPSYSALDHDRSVVPKNPPDDINITLLGAKEGSPRVAIFKIEKPKERELRQPAIDRDILYLLKLDTNGRLINKDEFFYLEVTVNVDLLKSQSSLDIELIVSNNGTTTYKYQFRKISIIGDE